MSKKIIASILLSTVLVNNSAFVYASVPYFYGPNFPQQNDFIGEGQNSLNGVGNIIPTPAPISTPNFTEEETFRILSNLSSRHNQLFQNFLNLCYVPSENLVRRFTRDHAFNFVEMNGVAHVMVFAHSYELINLAARIRDLMNSENELLTLFLIHGRDGTNIDSNEFERRLNQLNTEIFRLNRELDAIQPNKPTMSDYSSGRLVETHLMD